MVQTRQNVRSTKPKAPTRPVGVTVSANNDMDPVLAENSLGNELHIRVQPLSKLYTDDTGRFPVRSRSGNQYIMIAYHCNSNAILAEAFKTRADKHRLIAYNNIIQ